MIFGWSRWSKILSHCEFSATKRRYAVIQTEQDVESLSRAMVAYALKNYHGDETIKQFILDLIDPSKSNFDALKNHQGLAAPVPRGRKPRKTDTGATPVANGDDAPAADSGEKTVSGEKEESKTTEKNGEIGETPAGVNIWDLEWAKGVEDLLGDENYKKHLLRQSNRVLLRLR